MNFENLNLEIIASLMLLIAMIDDFFTRKVHNILLLSFLIITLSLYFVLPQLHFNFSTFAINFAVSFLVLFVVTSLGLMGAGDMKLLVLFSSFTGFQIGFSVTILAFIWGAFWGLLLSIVHGHFFTYLSNIQNILLQVRKSKLKLQSMPFTGPIFLAWLTYLKLSEHHIDLFSVFAYMKLSKIGGLLC